MVIWSFILCNENSEWLIVCKWEWNFRKHQWWDKRHRNPHNKGI